MPYRWQNCSSSSRDTAAAPLSTRPPTSTVGGNFPFPANCSNQNCAPFKGSARFVGSNSTSDKSTSSRNIACTGRYTGCPAKSHNTDSHSVPSLRVLRSSSTTQNCCPCVEGCSLNSPCASRHPSPVFPTP